jgi:DNA-binding transcriptional ArsR family regulator
MMFLARVAPRPPERKEQRIILRRQSAPEQQQAAQKEQQQAPAAQQPGQQQRQPAVASGIAAGEFEQICRLFGALSERDTGHTVVRVYKVVIERAHPQNGIGSSELADIGDLNRLTVLHHLNRLAELGMLEKRGPRYYPRDFEEIFDEFEKQALENIRRARIIARQLEKQE